MRLTLSSENIANRIQIRDGQMNISRPLDEIERQAADCLCDQRRFITAVTADSMDWDFFASAILPLPDAPF